MQSILQQGLSRYLSPAQLSLLASTKVGIAGTGGLGSNCAAMLTRSGIRNFVLVDFDQVEPSNLNRQFFFESDIGRLKVEALAEHLLKIDPGVKLEIVAKRLTQDNCAKIFNECAVVVEALDQAEQKAMLCSQLADKMFIVCASGLGGIGGPELKIHRLGSQLVCIGDFISECTQFPPFAPRVIQAAAMQADVVLQHVLGTTCNQN